MPNVVRILLVIGFVVTMGIFLFALSTAPIEGCTAWLVVGIGAVAIDGYGFLVARDTYQRSRSVDKRRHLRPQRSAG
jgi:hypothetical protein